MSHSQDPGFLPFFRSPLKGEEDWDEEELAKSSVTRLQNSQSVSTVDDEKADDRAAFKRQKETTNSELFYDLFFVANLTVFTSVHEVNDIFTFKQYIGFFALLWLTWYQVSLYDVRFGADSVIDRIAKALQFGVMMGFAVIGPQYDVGTPTKGDPDAGSWRQYRSLSLILMASRFVLVLQYLQVLLFTRRIKSTRGPFSGIAAVYFVAGSLYLGLFFVFSDQRRHTYIAWYIIALAEAITVTAISTVWRVISFKGTHLIQRMSLLTLIFLGEGIIGAAREVQTALTSPVFGSSSTVIGNIVSLVLILYFLYMMYFDWIEEKHFGSVREQLWAFLHFPLHLALVVAVEGISQVFAWTTASDADSRLSDLFNDFPIDGSEIEVSQAAAVVKKTADRILTEDFTIVEYSALDNWYRQQQTIYDNFGVISNLTMLRDDRLEALADTYLILSSMLYSLAGFAPIESALVNGTSDNDTNIDASIEAVLDDASGQYGIFTLTFSYTFISVGLVVILIGAIACCSKIGKKGAHWLRLAMTVVVGVGICLVASIARGADAAGTDVTPFDRYITSAWMLPTLVFALFLAVFLNNVKLPSMKRRRAAVDSR